MPESLHLVARGSASNLALRVGGVCWRRRGAVEAWESRLGPPPREPPPPVIVPEGKALDLSLPGGGDADRAGLWKCR